jgi:hypothetical protein
MLEETIMDCFFFVLMWLDLAAGTEEDLSKDGQSVDEIGDRIPSNKDLWTTAVMYPLLLWCTVLGFVDRVWGKIAKIAV